MFKNVASQKIVVFAFDTTTGAPKTGDAANISLYVSKDWGAVTQLGDTSATELDSTNAKGWYLFDLTQAETSADALLFSGKSSTANISVVGDLIFTTPPNFNAASIDGSGRVDVGKLAGTAQTGRDIGASVLLSAGTGTGQLDITAGVVKANLVQILATALTETAGLLAAGFKKLFNVASPVFDLTSVIQTGDAYARIGAAGAGLTAVGDTRLAHLDADVSSRLAPATAGRTLVVDAAGLADANMVKAGPSGLGTAQTAADIGEVAADVDELIATVGVAGAGLTAVGDTRLAHLDADVSSRLAPATAGRTLVVDAAGLADANMVKAGPTGAGTAQTAADIGEVAADVDELIATVGVAGAGLTALGDTRLAHLDADVSSRLAPATAGRTLVVDAAGLADANMVKAGPTGAGTAQTAADIGEAAADVDELITTIGVAGAGLTALGDTRLAHLDADVSSRLATSGYVSPDNSDIGLIKAKTDLIPVSIDGYTLTETLTLIASTLIGKVSGLPTAPAFRDLADTKDRVTATTDADGNRTTITLDAS